MALASFQLWGTLVDIGVSTSCFSVTVSEERWKTRSHLLLLTVIGSKWIDQIIDPHATSSIDDLFSCMVRWLGSSLGSDGSSPKWMTEVNSWYNRKFSHPAFSIGSFALEDLARHFFRQIANTISVALTWIFKSVKYECHSNVFFSHYVWFCTT